MHFAVTERELLVASRQKATFWLRLGVSLVGLFVCVSMLLASGAAAQAAGSATFQMVIAISFAYAVLSGYWLTADCISEERREGTLPLLYLTRVGSWELILGKFAGTSLRGFYGLVAILPIAAIPVLAGGVPGAHLWQMPLLLLLTMAQSVTAGLAASAMSTEQSRAYAITTALLAAPLATGCFGTLLVLVIILISHFEGHETKWRKYVPWCLMFWGLFALSIWALSFGNAGLVGSAVFTWSAAFRGSYNAFVASAVLQGAIALFYLASAVYMTEWRLGAKEMTAQKAAVFSPADWERRPERGRKRLPIADRPLEWLMRRQLPGPGLFWFAVLVSMIAAIFGPLGLGRVAPFGRGVIVVFFIPALLLSFAIARHAATGLVGMRQNGLLEVVLTTPATWREILRAQAVVCWKTLRFGLVAVLLVQNLWVMRLFMLSNPQPPAHSLLTLLYAALGVANFFLYVFALLWVGMQFAMRKSKASQAAVWTVLWVGIVPSLLTFLPPFAGWIFSRIGGAATYYWFLPGLLGQIAYGAIYLGLIRWARIKLLGSNISPEQQWRNVIAM